MSDLAIQPDGLAALAERCEAWACEVVVGEAPVSADGSASAAAVTAACARAGLAGEALAARMRASAGLIRAAAAALTAVDTEGSAALGAVSEAR